MPQLRDSGTRSLHATEPVPSAEMDGFCRIFGVETEYGLADTGAERVVGVVPVSGHMDLKALAAAVGAKKASMADPKVAMRESGYVVGGISPLGQKTRHKTVLDESALQFDQILVSGGKRGLSVGVNPQDLLKVLNAVAAPIGTW